MEKHGQLRKIQSCKCHELLVEGKKGHSIATDTQTSKPEFLQQSYTQGEKSQLQNLYILRTLVQTSKSPRKEEQYSGN